MSTPEIMIYNGGLTYTESYAVNNYFSVRYNIPMMTQHTNFIRNEPFIHDVITLGAYKYETVSHLNVGNCGGLVINIPESALPSITPYASSTEFLFAAHNGEDFKDNFNENIDRKWYLQVMGTIENADLYFDFSQSFISAPDSASGYKLFYTDGFSQFTELDTSGILAETAIKFHISNVQTGFYAVGKGDASAIPVPDPFPDKIINTRNDENALNVYPNPVINNITVEYQLNKESKVGYQLYNEMGILIMNEEQTTKNKGNHVQLIQTENLRAGLYYLSVQIDNTRHSVKVIKQ
jgi:hypothetical protein